MTTSQKRTLVILVALLAVFALLFVLLSSDDDSTADSSDSTSAVDSSVDSSSSTSSDGSDSSSEETEDTFTAISYNNETASLSFALDEDGNWYWVDDPSFPLDQDYLVKLSGLLTDLTPLQTITDGDTLDAYGLDDSTMSVTAEGAETSLTVALGDITPDGSGYYALENNDDSIVYILNASLQSQLQVGIYEMMELPELPALTESNVSSVTVSGTVTTELVSQTDDDGNVTWQSGTEDVTDAVADLVSEVCGLALDHCEDYRPSEEAVSQCGLDAPVCTVTVYYTDEAGNEVSQILSIGGVTVSGDCRYARLDMDDTIYGITASSVSALLETADSGLQTA